MIHTLWQQIGLKDLIDILIVAVLCYQFLLIARGTRAVQMLFGVGALGALFWLSLSYELYSVNWFLERFFESFFIIIIIIFQDQIRSALASFGRGGKVFGGLNKDKEEEEMDEILEVCGLLSKRKIGGLIVLEREVGLMNYVATGSRIDSQIYADLIYSIFQTNSPLHDGAIIISNGLLTAVGCFLPLSHNIEVDRHLGTRHRAALGVSEETDALAIVISEETGKISLCLNGELYLIEDEKYLRQYLKFLFTHNKMDSKAVSLLKATKKN